MTPLLADNFEKKNFKKYIKIAKNRNLGIELPLTISQTEVKQNLALLGIQQIHSLKNERTEREITPQKNLETIFEEISNI